MGNKRAFRLGTGERILTISQFIEPSGRFYTFQKGFSRALFFLAKKYPTLRHWVLAHRFAYNSAAAPQLPTQIRHTDTTDEAEKLANAHMHEARPDWEENDRLTRIQGLNLKFQQHPTLGDALDATGDSELICEDSELGEEGAKHLGEALMKLRTALRNQRARHGRKVWLPMEGEAKLAQITNTEATA